MILRQYAMTCMVVQVLIANAWHHRSDALSSIVAVAGIGGTLAGVPCLDPLGGETPTLSSQ